jgi:predicted amidohydrolase YtcJ
MFMDGVIETNTAVMLAPYVNVPTTGQPNYTLEAFNTIVQMMDRRGWQIMVHALGDGAVRMVLDGFEWVGATGPAPARGRRHRIEHIETIDPADVPRFGKLGVIASMHPVSGFTPPTRPPPPAGAPVGAWAGNIGPERAARGGMEEHFGQRRSCRVRGDWPVATIDALRKSPTSSIADRDPAELDQLTMTAAIDRYTSGPANASFDEGERHARPGMLADIAVIGTDVFAKPPAERADISCSRDGIRRKVVYRRRRDDVVLPGGTAGGCFRVRDAGATNSAFCDSCRRPARRCMLPLCMRHRSASRSGRQFDSEDHLAGGFVVSAELLPPPIRLAACR